MTAAAVWKRDFFLFDSLVVMLMKILREQSCFYKFSDSRSLLYFIYIGGAFLLKKISTILVRKLYL
jgi:hypothetical protein